jgi:hypothetical protein
LPLPIAGQPLAFIGGVATAMMDSDGATTIQNAMTDLYNYFSAHSDLYNGTPTPADFQLNWYP